MGPYTIVRVAMNPYITRGPYIIVRVDMYPYIIVWVSLGSYKS